MPVFLFEQTKHCILWIYVGEIPYQIIYSSWENVLKKCKCMYLKIFKLYIRLSKYFQCLLLASELTEIVLVPLQVSYLRLFRQTRATSIFPETYYAGHEHYNPSLWPLMYMIFTHCPTIRNIISAIEKIIKFSCINHSESNNNVDRATIL